MFNTAIAAVMELYNVLADYTDRSPQGRAVVQEALDLVVLMLSPIIPHATQAMWQALGHRTLLVDERWPDADAAARDCRYLLRALFRPRHRAPRRGAFLR